MKKLTVEQLQRTAQRARDMLGRTKTQRMICIAALTVIMVLGIWIPYITMEKLPEEEPAQPSASTALPLRTRMEAFARWHADSSSEASESVRAEEIDRADLRAGERLVRRIQEALVPDREETRLLSGATEYMRLGTGEDSFVVMHFYKEWQGDWGNWLNLYADAETGEVFYLYVSCGCRTNPETYADMETLDCAGLAGTLSELTGIAVEAVYETGDQTGICFVSAEESLACYDLKCLCYPANLIDYTICAAAAPAGSEAGK